MKIKCSKPKDIFKAERFSKSYGFLTACASMYVQW